MFFNVFYSKINVFIIYGLLFRVREIYPSSKIYALQMRHNFGPRC